MPIEDTKMDWNTLYCPNKCCRYYGIPFQPGKMVKNGSSHGQLQALCRGCGGSVALSYATAYYGLERGVIALFPAQTGLVSFFPIKSNTY